VSALDVIHGARRVTDDVALMVLGAHADLHRDAADLTQLVAQPATRDRRDDERYQRRPAPAANAQPSTQTTATASATYHRTCTRNPNSTTASTASKRTAITDMIRPSTNGESLAAVRSA
jgi:hypothetical protein